MVTYDGRAGMCCYDWGSTHPVGFFQMKVLMILINLIEK